MNGSPEPTKSRHITVSGLPGSGTTTLCRILEKKTGLPYTYAGAIFRAEAKRRGMELAAFGALCQEDASVDQALDDQQLGLLRGEPRILEGRLSGWLAKQHHLDALAVWVRCDQEERLCRIHQRDGGDPDEQRRKTLEREASEADRYRRYYDADPTDEELYDLVLDSTDTPPEELAAAVLRRLTNL